MSQKLNLNWRQNEFVLETIEITQYAWSAAKSAPPLVGAIAGVVLMFIFGMLLPLLMHIFFGDVDGLVGFTLGFLSGAVAALFRVFGFVAGLICWGMALRNFAASRRQQAIETATEMPAAAKDEIA
jgi:protein-S-isoprenylcysteine O-methyltransferase Ste14